MSKHTITVTFNNRAMKEMLYNHIIETIDNDCGSNVERLPNGKDFAKRIRKETDKLLPAFQKKVLAYMKVCATECEIDAIDEILGWTAENFPPLLDVIYKYANDDVLKKQVDNIDRERKLERLHELAAEFGYCLAEAS